MQLGIIGLGRMGSNMAKRLLRHGHDCVVFDSNPAAAIESSAPAPVLSAALFQRFASRGEGDFSDRLLSAMRYQFGGHVEHQASTLAGTRS